MRIAFVLSPWAALRDGATGGAERVTVELARALRGRGHVVDIYAPRTPDLPQWVRGVQPRARGRARTWAYATALRKVLAQYDGVVAVNCPWLSLVARKRTLLYVQNYGFRLPLLTGTKRFLGRLLWKNCIIAACSPSVERWLREEQHVPGMVVLVPNGVDLVQFSPSARPNFPPIIVGFAGQWSAKKGFPVLIEAARQLSHRADIRFALAGSPTLWGESPPDEGTRTAMTSLPPNVYLSGLLPHAEMPRFYRGLHVLAVPSTERFEGLPLVALEAMACGVPILGTNLPGIRDVVIDGVNGVLVEPASPRLLAEAIRALVDTPGLLERLAQGARRSALNYSLDEQARRLEEALELVVRGYRGGMRT